jgi:glucokinase
MDKRAVVALDVGGTTVDAACISVGGRLIGHITGTSSPAALAADKVVDTLAEIIATARGQARDHEVTACGIAIPGPFDYAAGISRMTHKFEAINGLPLGGALQARSGLPVCFINDAAAFGIGAGARQLPGIRRFVALTIGTGLGSSFIDHGESIESGGRVPPDGEVWNLPLGDGILEDRASARGVVSLYRRDAPGEPLSAKDVSDRAGRGDQAAIGAYREMGTALGSALAPALARFAPEAIIVGGKVGRSLPLFGPALTDALAAAGLPTVPVVQADGNLALWGAADSAAKLSAGNAHKLAARRGNKRCVMSSPATP